MIPALCASFFLVYVWDSLTYLCIWHHILYTALHLYHVITDKISILHSLIFVGSLWLYLFCYIVYCPVVPSLLSSVFLSVCLYEFTHTRCDVCQGQGVTLDSIYMNSFTHKRWHDDVCICLYVCIIQVCQMSARHAGCVLRSNVQFKRSASQANLDSQFSNEQTSTTCNNRIAIGTVVSYYCHNNVTHTHTSYSIFLFIYYLQVV